MPTIYQLNLHDLHYAIFKDEIESVCKVEDIHKIPFSPDCIVGLAIIDNQNTALADLATLIGLPPFDLTAKAQVLLIADHKKDTGFVVNRDIAEISIPEESIQPIPDYAATPEISSCILYEGKTIPLIDLKALYKHIHSANIKPSIPTFPVPKKISAPFETNSIQIFTAGNELFAIPANMIIKIIDKPDAITQIPLTPDSFKGIISEKNSIIPVIDLAEKIGLLNRGESKKLLIVDISGEHFGVLVEMTIDKLLEMDFSIHPLPLLANSGLISEVAIHKHEIIPIINPQAVIDPEPDSVDYPALDKIYQSDKTLDRQFLQEHIEINEFLLLSELHALPNNEVEEILPILPFRQVPDLHSLVIGIVEYQGEILPVMDLALLFGQRSFTTNDWSMVLVNNRKFRAFIITEKIYPERSIPLNIRKTVPVKLPHKLIYACYPDDNTVRLIVNVAAIAVHFEMIDTINPPAFFSKDEAAKPPKDRPVPFLAEAGVSETEVPPAEVEDQLVPDDTSIPEIEEKHQKLDAAANKEEARTQKILGQQKLDDDALALAKAEDLNQEENRSAQMREAEAKAVKEHQKLEDEAIRERAQTRKIMEQQKRDAEALALAKAERLKQEEKRSAQLRVTEAKAEEDHLKIEAEAKKEISRTRKIMERQKRDAKVLAIAKERRLKLEAKVIEERKRIRKILELQKQEIGILRAKKAQIRAEKIKKVKEEEGRSRLQIEAKNKAAALALQLKIEKQQIRKSEQEKVRILAEFREKKKNDANGNKLIKTLLAILLLLILFALIFFVTTDKKPPAPLGNEENLIETGIDQRVRPQLLTTTKKTSPKPIKMPEPMENPGIDQPPLAIIVPDNIPLTNNFYIVKKGDNLWSIANRFTGNPYNYPFVAKENEIVNPDLIFPGQIILLKRRK